jgi:nucleolar protein 6
VEPEAQEEHTEAATAPNVSTKSENVVAAQTAPKGQPLSKGNGVEKPKKRKQLSDLDDSAKEAEAKPKKKKKSVVEGSTEAAGSEEASKPSKSRHILFVGNFPCFFGSRSGNLPFTATVEDIRKHFDHWGLRMSLSSLTPSGGAITVRLLTKKGTNEPRGCAFVEFDNGLSHSVK